MNGKNNNRIERLQILHAKDPVNIPLTCDLAEELLHHGRVGEARGILTGAARNGGEPPRVRFLMARCELTSGSFQSAAELLDSLIAQGSASPAVRHDLAFAHLCRGRTREAAEALGPVFSQAEPIPAECHLLQARILHHQARLQEALDATDRALAGGGVDADALGERALLLLDLGSRESALAGALECLVRYPSQLEALIVRGTVALWSGRTAEAADAFTTALRHNPKAGRARSGLAQVSMLSGELTTARDLFVEAVCDMPDHIGTWHALAWCQMLLGELDAAADSYQRAFALDRAFGETHGGIAIVHALLGRTQEAEQSIRRALRLDPRGRNARYAQSLLLMTAGRDREAGELIAPVLREAGAGSDDPIRMLKQLHAKLAAGRTVQT